MFLLFIDHDQESAYVKWCACLLLSLYNYVNIDVQITTRMWMHSLSWSVKGIHITFSPEGVTWNNISVWRGRIGHVVRIYGAKALCSTSWQPLARYWRAYSALAPYDMSYPSTSYRYVIPRYRRNVTFLAQQTLKNPGWDRRNFSPAARTFTCFLGRRFWRRDLLPRD